MASKENKNIDINLTNEANSNVNDGGGEDLSEDNGGAENKVGDGGSGKTTPIVPPCKPNLWAERLQEDFIPEESKRKTTKDLTQLILRHPYSQLASMVENEYKDLAVLTITSSNKGQTVLLHNFRSLKEQPLPT